MPILVISRADPVAAAPQVARFGAVGFIGKDAGLVAIEHAIAAALASERMPVEAAGAEGDTAIRVASLTPTQLRVLLGVLAGRLNKQTAFDHGIGEPTVKSHMTAVLRKLDVGKRTQAALAARTLGPESAGCIEERERSAEYGWTGRGPALVALACIPSGMSHDDAGR